MATFSPVLHSAAAPVTLAEFLDAIRATCLPRFPHLRANVHRSVALAVSGGVDSMALAYLCSQLRREASLRVSDSPVRAFRGIIVDHRLRPESEAEANAVAKALRALGIKPVISVINWRKELDLDYLLEHPNIETLARRMRYRRIGLECAYRGINSIMVAHHADDQYETLLMRLLNGHASRGLRGMRPASEIPECEGMHGAFRSGMLDESLRSNPFLSPRPSRKARRSLRRRISGLLSEADEEEGVNPMTPDPTPGLPLAHEEALKDFYHSSHDNVDHASPSAIDIEDGGIMVYRPLLGFSKERLMATCHEHNITWFEDSTNADPTLTQRNAVRTLHKQHQLPKALQKPAVLALAKRCDAKHSALEAEGARLARQIIVHDFDSVAGTLLMQFPDIECRWPSRHAKSIARYRARVARHRELASMVLRQVIAIVSPELNHPIVAILQNPINTIFPKLLLDQGNVGGNSPKAFNVHGVLFRPVPNKSVYNSFLASDSKGANERPDGYSWYLSRAPYASPVNKPLPIVNMRYCTSMEKPLQMNHKKPTSDWTEWMAWELWDGRFWIRWRHRLPFQPYMGPYHEEHSKSFRERLDKGGKERLADLLKRHAPGKTRYTLPAIYVETVLDFKDMPARPLYPYRLPEKKAAQLTPHSMLLSLPTLGVNASGVDRYIQYEIRYKRVNRSLLRSMSKFTRSPFLPPVARPRIRHRKKVKRHMPCRRTAISWSLWREKLAARKEKDARSRENNGRELQPPPPQQQQQPRHEHDGEHESQFVLDL